jgi:hypothetical protein
MKSNKNYKLKAIMKIMRYHLYKMTLLLFKFNKFRNKLELIRKKYKKKTVNQYKNQLLGTFLRKNKQKTNKINRNRNKKKKKKLHKLT